MLQSLEVPAITVCMQHAHKNFPVDIALNEESFVNNTYDIEDIIESVDDEIWTSSETRSSVYGRCYTFEARGRRRVPAVSMKERLNVKRGIDLQIFGENVYDVVYLKRSGESNP